MSTAVAEPPPGGYQWPPLPILDVEQAAQILAERLGEAYDDLEAQRLRTLTAAALGRESLTAANLASFQQALSDFVDRAQAEVVAWLRLHLGPRYAEGVQDVTHAPMDSWSQIHLAALTSLAVDTYDDFLQRALAAERVSERFVQAVREAAAVEIPKIAAGGRTAIQVGDQLEQRLLGRYGIDTVTYSDGSQVPVRVYARMVARTKSGVAYNAGTLNELHAEGQEYVEVFDGHECGWSSHDDPDRANGTVRSIVSAAAHALSHPQCRRAFGARPDVTTDEEARNAQPTVEPARQADQSASEDAQRAAVTPLRPRQAARARRAAMRAARATGATSDQDVQAIIDQILKDRGLSD